MQHIDLFSTDELLALAALDLEQDNLAEGLTKLKHILKQDVISDELDSMLGSVYAKLKLFSDAEKHYSALLERSPVRLHERFQLGMVYREMGEIAKAVECWDKVLEEQENYPPVLFHKALLLLAVDEEDECSSLLQRLISTADNNNYYVERANEVLKELNVTDDISATSSPKLTEVH